MAKEDSILKQAQNMARQPQQGRQLVTLFKDELAQALTPTIERIMSARSQELQMILQALREIRIDSPQVNVTVPEVKIPTINVPQTFVPEPKVTVNVPEVRVPNINIPKTEINYPDVMKASLQGIDRTTPLPVILIDPKGGAYVAQGGGAHSVKVSGIAQRQQVVSGTATLTRAQETTVLTGQTGFFNDMVLVTASNSSTAAVTVDFADSTGGATRFSLSIPATDVRGISFTVPLTQTLRGGNWTAHVSGSDVSDSPVTCLIEAVKNT